MPLTRALTLPMSPSLANSQRDQLSADRFNLGKDAQELLALVLEHLVGAAYQLLVDHGLQRR